MKARVNSGANPNFGFELVAEGNTFLLSSTTANAPIDAQDIWLDADDVVQINVLTLGAAAVFDGFIVAEEYEAD